MHRIAFISLLIATLASCSSKQTPSLSKEEKAHLLGPRSNASMRWHKVAGPDFRVYHGLPQSPAEGEIGFYIGGHPSFAPAAGSTRHAGKIGTHKVMWHRRTRPDGLIYQTTLFALDDAYKIHAWVLGKTQSELDSLAQELGTLRLFSEAGQKQVSR